MQVLSTQFISKQVISVQNSELLGVLQDFVIKKDNLKIVAFVVHVVHKKDKFFLLPSDIRFFSNQKLLVDSFQKLSEFSELVRYQGDIENNYKLIGKKVQTASGKKLGKVSSFVFDPAHYFVTKLNVRPSIFKNIFYTKLLIDRENVIDIKKKYIVVKDNYAKIKKPATAVLPAQS